MRKSASRLRGLIQEAKKLDGKLPLVHITDAYRFTELTDSTHLIPVDCQVFKEPLVYLFYGRPAYKTKRSGTLPLAYDLPIAFVFKPEFSIEYIRRVFPFDTGAFERGLYRPYFHPNSEISDFELEPNMDSVGRLLGFFYQSHEEYMIGRSTRNVAIPITSFEAQGLHELARAPADPTATGTLDERASSVELQTNRPVPLNDNLLAVILPNLILNDENIRTYVSSLNSEIITYEAITATNTQTYAAIIYEKVISLYRAKGIL